MSEEACSHTVKTFFRYRCRSAVNQTNPAQLEVRSATLLGETIQNFGV
jgi:hypothetical protein